MNVTCPNCQDQNQTAGTMCTNCNHMVPAAVIQQQANQPTFWDNNKRWIISLVVIVALIAGGIFAVTSGIIKLPGTAPVSAPVGGTTGLAACTGDQVVYFMSNAVLDGGTDCTLADGSLLSAKTPNAVVTSPLACTGDQVMYFVTNGSLNAGVDCTLSDGSLLSVFKSPASTVTTTLAACTADQVLNFTSNGALAGGVDCAMPDGSLLSTHAPAAVVTTVSACSADQVLSFMSNGALAGGVDCTMPNGSLLSTHAPAAVVTNPLPVGNGGSPVLNPTGGSNAPVAMTLRQDVLKYDMTDCDPANFQACVPDGQWNWYVADKANRHLFPALYIQNVQSGDLTPAEAIAAIQQMGAGWAQSADGWSTIAVDDRLATLVWNAQRNTCEYVPDTARPLENAVGTPEEWQNSIVIVSAHPLADPAAAQITVTCSTSDNWSTLMQ